MNKIDDFNKKQRVNKFDIFIMIFLVGVVPFLVRGLDYQSPFANADGTSIVMFDYFNLIKVYAIRLIAFFILINEAYDFFTSERVMMFKYKYKELITVKTIFAFIIVISTIVAFIFSEYKPIALKGATERFESIWIHFSYIIIFFYSLKFFKKEDAFKIFSIGILISTFVVGLIGTFQAIGLSPFDSNAFLHLTIPDGRNVQITMPGSFTTMYNTNTSASYSVLMMYVLMLIFAVNKNKKIRVCSGIIFILIFITFVFSYSEGSYLALLGSVFVVAIFVIMSLFLRNRKKAGIISLCSLLGLIIVSGITLTSISPFKEKFQYALNKMIGDEALFTDWSQDGNDFYFYNRSDEYIRVSTNIEDNFEIYENEQKLYAGENVIETTLNTEAFGDIYINSYNENSTNYINFNNFFLIRNNSEPLLLSIDTYEPLRYVDWVGFEGYNNLFTNRGFIWSRSIPLVFDKPLGYGADTFMVYFPNDDIIGKAFCDWPVDVYADKPHSIYLNMAINNGVLYLIGFLGIIGICIFEKFKLVQHENVNFTAIIIYIGGISAYLINGLSTDNIVVIIMLFWVYLAIDNSIFIKQEEN